MLEKAGQELKSHDLRVQFVMVAERGLDYSTPATVEIVQQELSYPKNLDLINRARCLLELTQSNQTGLTIRCLEALFFGKKLITDNPLVRQLPFYRPDRFFVIGFDDPNRIVEFVTAEVPPIANAELSAYEFPNWIRQFEVALMNVSD